MRTIGNRQSETVETLKAIEDLNKGAGREAGEIFPEAITKIAALI